MTRFGVLAALALLLVTAPLAGQPSVTLYVAPDGRDTWSGRLAIPNKAKSDGPFATLERARDAIRERRAAGPIPGGVTVLLRQGVYPLADTLVFEPRDSGTVESPVIYAAYPGERPVVSCGRQITGWKVAGGRWEAALPAGSPDGWSFSHLYVNGERRYRPRLPRQGYYFAVGSVAPAPQNAGKGADAFRFRRGDIRADWHNRDDVEVACFHCWSVSRLHIASVDEEARVVTFTGRTWHPGMAALGRGARYLVENVREALQPGEWYLDRKARTLTYLPRKGETPANTTITAPAVERLLFLRGDIGKREWVQHLTFRGITFAHANWVLPPEGRSIPQAECTMGAAIHAEGARDCAFERCAINQTSAYALELGNGTKRCRVESCELTDLGGGGVKIGPNASGDDEAVASHNTVRDCLIAHGGRMHPPAVGIWLGYAHHNTLEHNDIFDLYYSGISAGWSWGYGRTPTRDNLIAYNHIWAMPQEVLGDEAGIYTLGISPGTVIRGNHVHDQVGVPWGVGIYLDEGSSNILVEDNLVYNCTTHSFNVNYGRENVARNNIFGPILDEKAPLLRCGRMEGHLSMTLQNNILYWNVGELADKAWPAANCALDSNLYWNFAGKPVKFGQTEWAQWQQGGQDARSLVADPLFRNAARGDFTLRSGSPALKAGFKPFDWRKAGRLTRPSTPYRLYPRAFPPAPRSLPAQPITQDYEGLPVGARDDEGTSHEEDDQSTARVTEETAASGKRSLKFTDLPGQKAFYNPHLYYSPGFRSGVVTVSFDLRVEPGALVTHQWRDDANPFHSGPSLHVAADGTLRAGDQTLLKLPHGQWVHYEVTCGLGDKATGRCTVTVTLPGEAPKRFADLPCNPECKALTWLGFVSDSTEKAVFYLDNVRIGPAKP